MPIDPLATEWPYDDAEPLTEPLIEAPADIPPDDLLFDDGANWEDGWE